VRTFREEHKRLRGLLRGEGLDPYRPAEPFVSVGERHRRSKLPRQRRVTAAEVSAAWEQAMSQSEDMYSPWLLSLILDRL
jgi:hypothetical protein